MPSLSLREVSIQRLALRRDEAAASLAISPSLFDTWVKDGKMPNPNRVGGVVLWDAEAIRDAWRRLCDGDRNDEENPFDKVVA